MPIKIASRNTVPGEAGGVEGKRRFKNAITGKAVPVTPKTLKKKNSQRGPNVGNITITTATTPPQPITMSKHEAGKNDLTEMLD
jgi:hypothetical protein